MHNGLCGVHLQDQFWRENIGKFEEKDFQVRRCATAQPALHHDMSADQQKLCRHLAFKGKPIA